MQQNDKEENNLSREKIKRNLHGCKKITTFAGGFQF